jgi:hypothetical protein
MQPYQNARMSPALGGAAAVLATIGTLALAVFAPLQFAPNTDPSAIAKAAAPAPDAAGERDVANMHMRIDVIGSRRLDSA